MTLTEIYNEFEQEFKSTFNNNDLLENLNDIFEYIVSEAFMSVSLELECSDFVEMIAINAQEQYVNEYLASLDFHGEDSLEEGDMYAFMYQNFILLEMLYNKIKKSYTKRYITGDIIAKWSDRHYIELFIDIDSRGNKDVYYIINDGEIVVYTDLQDIEYNNIKNTKYLIKDLSNLFSLFNNLWESNTKNSNKKVFYFMIENFFYLIKRKFEYHNLHDEESFIKIMEEDIEGLTVNNHNTLKEMFILFKKELINLNFNGWLLDSFNIRYKDNNA